MSRFKGHFQKASETAKAAFADYRSAETALKNAESALKNYPEPHGYVTPEYMANRARAQADHVRAKEAFRKAKNTLADRVNDIARIRKELEADINGAYSAAPGDMDLQTLELLKSGILTGKEYANLIQEAHKAGNVTMIRVMGQYAEQAAAARADKYGANDDEAKALRLATYSAKAVTGENTLHNFDVVVETFRRSARNPAMIDHWGELTGEIIENA